jgi:hypothetical protein
MIALILMISMTTSIMLLPTTSAHSPAWTIPTNAYVYATPNPIGVGQYTNIVMWVDQNPPSATGTEGPRWRGYKLDITKPDGSKEVIDGMTATSSTASHGITYTPDQVGTYTIVFSWPGQTLELIPGAGVRTGGIAYIGDFFAGSTSQPMKLVVQEQPIAEWQEPPLPTEYWTRPINDANRGWSQLASNWLGGSWLVNNYQRWGTAPDSPHIMWTQPIVNTLAGGINDEAWPGIPSNNEDYESPWGSPIIMNGKLYYNSPPVSDWATYGYYCRDLYTGELIWYKNGTDSGLTQLPTTAGGYDLGQSYPMLSQGWLYHYWSVNGRGIMAYLIQISGSTWNILDANGNLRIRLINVPSGTTATDQDGSLLRYSYNAATGNLLCWNISQSIPPLHPIGTNQQQWKARFGATIDAVNDTTWTKVGTQITQGVTVVGEDDIRPRSGYTMNLTIKTGLPAIAKVVTDENRVPKMIFGQTTLGGLGDLGAGLASDTFTAWVGRIDEHVAPYSPYPLNTNAQNTNLGFGFSLLWDKTITVPLAGKNYTWNIPPGSIDYTSKTFVLYCKQTMQLWGYSLETGNLLWGPTKLKTEDIRYYSTDASTYDGTILCGGYGSLNAIDANTGNILWTYNATNIGYESPYGQNMPVSVSAVCDGKIYTTSSEHSPSKPLWRNSDIRCINMTDGTEIWQLLNYKMFQGSLGIADGYIIHASDYDNLIYCIGKGPSATTVEAPMTAITLGSSLVIRGTVTDISPGTKGLLLSSRFPNGVPAVADESMQGWMEYLYEQQAMPTDAKGVTVTLDAVDPNGNFVNIGTVTSDASGMFKKAFTPEVPGEYTIIASFAGSKSYYTSYAETAIAVSDAPATPAPTAVPVESAADLYFVPAIAGLFVFVAIIGVVIILVLRKRP